MKTITGSYRAEDKNILYQALRDLRSLATQFQMRCIEIQADEGATAGDGEYRG